MASRFVLNASVRLVGPTNARQVANQIQRNLNGIVANVNVKVNTSSLNSVNKQLSSTSRYAKTAGSDLEKFGEQAARAIRRYGAFTLATTAFIKLTQSISAGIDEAIAYDRELVRIAQVTGITTKGLKGLSQEVTRLATSYGVSSEKILEVAVTLSQAGLSAKNTKIALESLAKTGVSATFGDIKNTTEAAIAVMQQFGVEAKDLDSILSKINAVSAAFAIESEDVAVAVRRAGGAIQSAGGNFDEFQALLTSVRQTTRESAESIATGFRTIFARLQRIRTQNFLKNLGIDVLNDKGLFIGPYEAIRRISTALKGIEGTDPRFAQIVEELGGFRQVSKVIPLIEKFDVAQKALNVSVKGSSSLTKDAETAQQSLAVQFNKTKEEFLSLVRAISEDEAFRALLKTSLELTKAFIRIGQTLTPLIPVITVIGGFRLAKNFLPFATGFGKGIRGFNKGGLVPGSGNGDTVPAMLEPGEFVLRKQAVKSMGVGKVAGMNKYAAGGTVSNKYKGTVDRFAQGGEVKLPAKGFKSPFKKGLKLRDKEITDTKTSTPIYDFGVATLFPTGDKRVFSTTIDKNNLGSINLPGKKGRTELSQSAKVNFYVSSIKDDINQQLQSIYKANIENGIMEATTLVQRTIGGQASPQLVAKNLFSQIGGNAIVGSLFEGTLLNAGAPYDDDRGAQANLDFPNGVGEQLSKLFTSPAISSIPTDAKYTFNARAATSMVDKAVKYLTDTKVQKAPKVPGTSLIEAQKFGPTLSQNASRFLSEMSKSDKGTPLNPNTVAFGAGVDKKAIPDIVAELLAAERIRKGKGTVKLLNKGGGVGGSGNSDNVPALLTPGEFVINKKSAQAIGYGKLNRMNRVRKYASGGTVTGAFKSIGSSVADSPALASVALITISSFIQSLDGMSATVKELTQQLAIGAGNFAVFAGLIENGRDVVKNIFGISQFAKDYKKLRTPTDRKLDANDPAFSDPNANIVYKTKRFITDPNGVRRRTTVADLNTPGVRTAFERTPGLSKREAADASLRKQKLTIGGLAIAGAAGNVIGGFLSKSGNKDIENGKSASGKFQASAGGLLSGAVTGLVGGSAFGPVGAALGAVAGAAYGLYNAFIDASKKIADVKFEKSIEDISDKFKKLNSGFIKPDNITASISDFLKEAAAGIENGNADDNIAKLKNSRGDIEGFLSKMAESSTGLDEFLARTDNIALKFAVLAKVPYQQLISDVQGQLEANKKAKEGMDKFAKSLIESNNIQRLLTAFSSALASTKDQFDDLDNSVNSLNDAVSFTVPNLKSLSTSEIFKSASAGQFLDTGRLSRVSNNLLSPFGEEGRKVANQAGQVNAVRQALPDILRNLQRNPLKGEETSPEDFVTEQLKKIIPNLNQDILRSVATGITGVIGAEGKPSNLTDKFRADEAGTISDIVKNLDSVNAVMEQFADLTSQHNQRLTNIFSASEAINAKIRELSQQQFDNTSEITKSRLVSQNRFTVSNARGLDSLALQNITGSRNNDINDITARARAAKAGLNANATAITSAQREGGAIPENLLRERNGLTEAFNRNIQALQKLTQSNNELEAVQQELANATKFQETQRGFLETQTFGSRDDKRELAGTLEAFKAIASGKIGIDQLNNRGKQAFAGFAKNNAGVTLPNGLKVDDVFKKAIFDKNVDLVKAANPGLSDADARVQAQKNVESAFTENDLQKAAFEKLNQLTVQQNAAIEGLKGLLSDDDPLKTGLLREANNTFLTGLQNILVKSLVAQEQNKLTNAQDVIARAEGAKNIKDSKENLAGVVAARSEQEQAKKDFQAAQALTDTATNRLKNTKNTNDLGLDPKVAREILVQGGVDDSEITTLLDANTAASATSGTLGVSRDIVSQALKDKQLKNFQTLRTAQDKSGASLRDLGATGELSKDEANKRLGILNLAPSEAETNAAKITANNAQKEISRLNSSIAVPVPPAPGLSTNTPSAVRNNGVGQAQVAQAPISVDSNNFNNGVNEFGKITTDFYSNIEKLAGMEMTVNARHTVEVIINGSEAFSNMNDSFMKLAMGQIEKDINNMLGKKFPDIGGWNRT